MGYDTKGRKPTETFELQSINGKPNMVNLILKPNLKWYTTCLLLDQKCGGSMDFCQKRYNECACNDGGNCSFASVEIPEEVVVVITP